MKVPEFFFLTFFALTPAGFQIILYHRYDSCNCVYRFVLVRLGLLSYVIVIIFRP